MKRPFETGDRVNVYGGPNPGWGVGGAWLGTVYDLAVKTNWGNGISVKSDYDGCGYVVHPKQCYRLVKKPKRRVWVNPKVFIPGHAPIEQCLCLSENDWPEFIEVKKKGQ
jgi:hypothetical protein